MGFLLEFRPPEGKITMRVLLSALLLALLASLSSAFLSRGRGRGEGTSRLQLAMSRSSTNNVEDGVNISSLGVEDVGAYLRTSLASYLDKEFIAQEVHAAIGKRVEELYISGRREGVCDLGEMLMLVGTRLTDTTDISKSFLNEWDLANLVSDFLMVKLDRELCACAGNPDFYPNPNLKDGSPSRQQ